MISIFLISIFKINIVEYAERNPASLQYYIPLQFPNLSVNAIAICIVIGDLLDVSDQFV